MTISYTTEALAQVSPDPIEVMSVDITATPYYLGITALGATIIDADMHLAAGRKRAQVYIDEKGFLDETARRPDGTEGDEDDDRSTHLAISESRENGVTNIIGVTRLIQKRNEADFLPSERLFTDIIPAEVGSVEMSRYIARSEDRHLQNAASLALMRAAALKGSVEGVPHVYAVVEEPLYRYFKLLGLPFEPLSDLEWLEEYKSMNRAVRVDPREVIPALQVKDITRRGTLIAPFFEREVHSLGIGHFDANF